VIAFFRNALGYAFLGHWKEREGNANIEERELTDWLRRQGHSDKVVSKVLSRWAAVGRFTMPTAKSTDCSATA
jgi:type I restriction enzyme R subunit